MLKKVVSIILIISLLTVSIYADDIIAGLDISKALFTDIKAFIGDNQIPAMSVDGNIMVYVKDIEKCGFEVGVDGENREISINRDDKKRMEVISSPFGKNMKINDIIGSVKTTDVSTYIVADLYYKYIPSFSINGNTAILFSDLNMFGKISWNNESRVLKLEPISNSDNNLPLKYTSISEISSSSKDELLGIYAVDIYINLDTVKIELDKREIVIGVKRYISEVLRRESNTDNLIFLGEVIESIEGYSYSVYSPNKYDGYEWKTEIDSLGYKEKVPYKMNAYYDNNVSDIISNTNIQKVLDYKLKAMEVTSTYLKKEVEKKREALANELKDNKNVPLKVMSATVKNNSIGTPEVTVTVKNLTNKVIDAYELSFQCYDTYDRPVIGLGTKTNTINSIMQNIKVSSGKEVSGTVNLTLYDLTTKVKNVRITSAHFTDGTVWKSK